MSLKIGSNSFEVSPLFKEKLGNAIKNDQAIDNKELELLKQNASTPDEKSAVALLEKQKDKSNINISLDDDENSAKIVTFKVGARQNNTEDDGITPVNSAFKFTIPASNSKNDDIIDHLENNAIKAVPKFINLINKADTEKLLSVFGKTDVERITTLFDKIPDEAVKKSISAKISEIINNKALNPETQKSLISTVEKETNNFIKSQKYYQVQSELVTQRKGQLVESLEQSIASTKTEADKLKSLIHEKGNTPALEAQLKTLTEKIDLQSQTLEKAKVGILKRRGEALDLALNTSNKNRFDDILDAVTRKFGPDYTGHAKEVNDFLNSNPEIKKIIPDPEAYNLAIRRRPADLSASEIEAVKSIRNNFGKIPPEGKIYAKVFVPENGKFKNTDFKGFIIEPERLKGIKNEQDLNNLLRLDFGDKVSGLGNFKLSDVKIRFAKVFPDEVTKPYSNEFGGTRDTDIYTYPLSGSANTTPKGEFPAPESDLGKLKIDEVGETNLKEFLEKPIEELKVPVREREVTQAAKNISEHIEKIPDTELKGVVSGEIEKILKNKEFSPAKKKELLEGLQKEVGVFNKRQTELGKQLIELKTKYGEKYINDVRDELKATKEEVGQLKKLVKEGRNDLLPSLEAATKKLEDAEGKYARIEGRRLESLEKTISHSDGLRLKDIVSTSQKSFGPPYVDPVAKKVEDFIEANPELKKVFKNPDEVNLAIRKFPTDLKPEEIEALKKIRTFLTKIPAEGIPVVKVSFPGEKGELKKFVIEAEHLKGVKDEKELVDLLKLDYHGSPFLKDGKINFKLSDIQVTVGRVFETEVKTPFSKEFGGTRDAIIYQYPFSGSGFTTPETGFPKPELDIGEKAIKDTKQVGWQEFIDKSPEELAPHRKPPESEVKTSEKKPEATEKIRTEEVKAKEEVPAKVKTEETAVKPKSEEVRATTNTETTIAKVEEKAENSTVSRIEKLTVNQETKEALKKLSEHPEFKGNEKALINIIESFEKSAADEPSIKILSEAVSKLEPSILAKSFADADKAEKVVSLLKNSVKIFAKYGLEAGEVIAKVGKGLLKILPVLGAAASGADAVRLARLAVTGKDPSSGADYIGYPKGDPRNTPENLEKLKDLRSLALLGSAANSLDTVLAVVEATGVGNADALLQIGLAGVETVVDLALDYFREHPDKLPDSLAKSIRAIALSTELASPVPTPISHIYDLKPGLPGKIAIANQLTELLKDPLIHGIKKIGDISAKVLDQNLDSIAKNTNQLADIIRNPEKYAQAFNKSIEQVIEEAKHGLNEIAAKGEKYAEEVCNALADVATHPGEYGKKAADLAINFGREIASGAKNAGEATLKFTKELLSKGAVTIEDSYKYLKTKSATLAKELVKDLINGGKELGAKFENFAIDFYNNPRKYGNAAVEIIGELNTAIANGETAAFNKLKDIAAKSSNLAKQALVKSVEKASELGHLTADYVKFVVNNPAEAGTKLVHAAKDFLINAVNSGKNIYNNAIDSLKELYDNTGTELGKFEDTLVDLAKQGGHAVNEIFSKHFDVIKHRLPEILDAAQNLGGAISDRLLQLVPEEKVVASLINNGIGGFKTFVNLAAKYESIANNFINHVTNELHDAYNKSSITNIDPLKAVIRKYYDQAKSLGHDTFVKVEKLLYQSAQRLDKNVLNDAIPDWLIEKLLKP